MADEKDSGEKTEEPTAQRREDFRKQGQVAQSKEVGSMLLIFGAAFAVWLFSRFFFEQLLDVFNYSFGAPLIQAVRTGDYAPALGMAMKKAFFITAPFLGLCAILSISSSLLQVGFVNNEEALKPNLKKLNPIEGFKRVYGLRSIFEGSKAFLKVLLITALAAIILKDEFMNLPLLMTFSLEGIFQYFGDIVIKLLFVVGIFMTVLAAIDYGYQRWELEKKMRMSKQEVKEEHKNREGDPQIKARIRRVQRELANKRMMEEIPKADVVITNPTHIAIVLKYGADFPSPKLVAKGAERVAETIKEIARENGVPIVENKPLARTIYKTMKIGSFIPRELYEAVAQVLSYVFKLKGKVV